MKLCVHQEIDIIKHVTKEKENNEIKINALDK